MEKIIDTVLIPFEAIETGLDMVAEHLPMLALVTIPTSFALAIFMGLFM